MSFPCGVGNIYTVPADTYFPVIWNHVIKHLTDIGEWQVLSNSCKNKFLFRGRDYAEALKCFMGCCNQTSDKGSRESISLQAKISSLAKGIVVVYELYYHPRRACYLLDMKTDSSKTFMYTVDYFAKYNGRLKRLEFLNGELKKVNP